MSKDATNVRTQINNIWIYQKSAEAIVLPEEGGRAECQKGKEAMSIVNADTEAETRKRTTYQRIGRNPKVKDKRSLTTWTRKRIRATSVFFF